MSKSRKDVETALMAKAAKDPEFRSALLANPRAAVAKEFGVDLPANLQVKVVEEDDNSLYLVLPAAAKARGSELSEADMSAVAGGMPKACSYSNSC